MYSTEAERIKKDICDDFKLRNTFGLYGLHNNISALLGELFLYRFPPEKTTPESDFFFNPLTAGAACIRFFHSIIITFSTAFWTW